MPACSTLLLISTNSLSLCVQYSVCVCNICVRGRETEYLLPPQLFAPSPGFLFKQRNEGGEKRSGRQRERRQGPETRTVALFLSVPSSFFSEAFLFTCWSTERRRRRRSKKQLIGVQGWGDHTSVHVPSSRVRALEVCLSERTRAAHELISPFESNPYPHFCGPSVLSRRTKEGRKERKEGGRKGGRGDEHFEAERVVQLRLIQTETGKTRQLWKSGEPQVSRHLWSF